MPENYTQTEDQAIRQVEYSCDVDRDEAISKIDDISYELGCTFLEAAEFINQLT